MKNLTKILSPQSLAERDECVELIARAQRVQGARCLHSDFEVSATTYREENPSEVSYAAAFDDESLETPLAIIGAEVGDDLKRAWLRGPFAAPHVEPNASSESMSHAFEALTKEVGARANIWDAYIETSHRSVLDWYESLGFFIKGKHSVFTVKRSDAQFFHQTDVMVPATPAIIEAIAALASESFPGGYLTRDDFAAPQSDEAVTLCVVEGDRLLGYVYASYEPGAIEANLDNLAVAPHARRSGIGRKLVNAALHWAFEIRNAPQMALVVREGNTNATALYESVGFRLLAEGTHLRLQRKHEADKENQNFLRL